MSILSDFSIEELVKKHKMIDPFANHQVNQNANGEKILSYGLSSYGYDARAATEFKIFTNVYSSTVDPKNFKQTNLVEIDSDVCVIPPNSFALGRTLEYFKLPRDVLGICIGKSTYARCGIIVNVTPVEPGCEGYVVLEFSNTTPLPARIYANEGICQFVFFKGDRECRVSYADRAGKYMNQTKIELPKV